MQLAPRRFVQGFLGIINRVSGNFRRHGRGVDSEARHNVMRNRHRGDHNPDRRIQDEIKKSYKPSL
jgi:hypothetical protein